MLDVGNEDPNQFSLLQKDTEAAYIGTEMRLMTDDGVLRQVVTKLGWPDDPAVMAAWQAATGGVGDITLWVGHRLAGNISARPFEGSSIVEIYYTAQSVDIAKAIVAEVRTAYIDNSLRLRAEAARKASAWNRTEAAQALSRLQRAEAERVAFLKANSIPIDSSDGNLEMRELTRARIDSGPSSYGAEGPVTTSTMQYLERRIAAIDAQIAVTSQERGPNDPSTVMMNVIRDGLKAQLARETAFAQAGENATEAQIAANRAARANQYLAARLRVLDRAPLFDRLAAIDRELTLQTRLYEQAAARVQDFDNVAAAPTGLKVIGDVIADEDPVFPNIPLAVGLGAGLSLGLGIGLAMLGEMIRRMVRSSADLEFYSGVPVLAVIAASAPKRRRGRLGALRPRFGFGRT